MHEPTDEHINELLANHKEFSDKAAAQVLEWIADKPRSHWDSPRWAMIVRRWLLLVVEHLRENHE